LQPTAAIGMVAEDVTENDAHHSILPLGYYRATGQSSRSAREAMP